VVDLAKRFGLTRELTGTAQAVIAESAGREFGMVVDMVTEVLRLDAAAVEPAQTVCGDGGFLRGIGKQADRLLIILDLDKLLSEEGCTQLPAAG
jgi:purine-binding chemotaxis protein CheW